MNKAELTDLIVDPGKIQRENIPELKTLASKYSFSPIFSLLLLSGLSQHDDFSFEEELNAHAYRVPDRIRLFELTHDIKTSFVSKEERSEVIVPQEAPQAEVSIASKEETIIGDTNEAETQIEEVENNGEEITTITPIEGETVEIDDDLPSLEESFDEKITEEPALKEKTEIIATPLEVLEDEKKVEPELNQEDAEPEITVSPLDTDVYASAVSRTIEQEVSEQAATENDEVERKEIEETFDNAEKEKVVATDFYSWLASKQHSNSSEKKQELKVQKEEKVPVSENISPEIEPKSTVEHIIEKFITNEPQISRPKKEFFSPSKVAKKSLDESSLPVSETLAQIFAAQGNYPKAIASYEQLMLKFPEKKSFFANQIQKLKQKLIK